MVIVIDWAVIKIAQRNPVRNSFASCNLKLSGENEMAVSQQRRRICWDRLRFHNFSYEFTSPLKIFEMHNLLKHLDINVYVLCVVFFFSF